MAIPAPFSASTAIPPRFRKDLSIEQGREQPLAGGGGLRAEIEKLATEAAKLVVEARQFDISPGAHGAGAISRVDARP